MSVCFFKAAWKFYFWGSVIFVWDVKTDVLF